MIQLDVNDRKYELDVPPDTPLLWVLREHLNLVGTKFGCGVGLCGSCTVHVNGDAERSCIYEVGNAQGKKITTIEGLPEDNPVKRAWIQDQVPQCGYCQPGQIMQAAALLAKNPNPEEQEIVDAMNGNLCRCGTYGYIKEAVKRAAREGRKS
jgi:isoquinoline 1-oxidoreductase alpha subunit